MDEGKLFVGLDAWIIWLVCLLVASIIRMQACRFASHFSLVLDCVWSVEYGVVILESARKRMVKAQLVR